MKKNDLKTNFINKGFFKFEKLNIEKKCKNLNDSILNYKNIDKNIFLSKKNYEKIKNKKFKKKDILDKFKINFLLDNTIFKNKINKILGKK